MNFDAERLELCAHRRVNVAVATRYVVASRPRERRDAAHEGSTDAENVNMHIELRRRLGRIHCGAEVVLQRKYEKRENHTVHARPPQGPRQYMTIDDD